VVCLQRFALSAIFMCTAGIWVVLSALKLSEAPKWLRVAEVAAASVLVAFCKVPVAFVFLVSIPLALVFMPVRERQHGLHQPLLGKRVAAHAPVALLTRAVSAVATIWWRGGQRPGFRLQDLRAVGMRQYSDIAAAISVPRPNPLGELTAQLSWSSC